MTNKASHSPELLLGPTTPAAYGNLVSVKIFDSVSRRYKLTPFDAGAADVPAAAVAPAVVALVAVTLATVAAASFDTPAVIVTGT